MRIRTLARRVFARRGTLTGITLGFLCLLTGAVYAGSAFRSHPAPAAPAVPRAPARRAQAPDQPLPVFIVYVTPDGFVPDETDASAGDAILVIRNLSRLDGLTCILATAVPTETTPIPVPIPIFTSPLAADKDAIGTVTLVAGQSLDLTEPLHPDWHCHITVVP